MEITLEFRTKRSICVQIQEQIKEEIREKRLLQGDLLPAVRELAAALQINFNTVARAYRELDRDGWISTQQGRGTYVLAQMPETSETGERDSHQALEELLDRLFIDIKNHCISETDLWEALEKRKGELRGISGRPGRRKVKRINRKPGYLQEMDYGGLRLPKRLKRISAKRIHH